MPRLRLFQAVVLIAALVMLVSVSAQAHPSPAAVGWGNLFVPGLGATIRGESVRGLVEAGGELGTFYAGTFLADQGHFSIDGTVKIPEENDISKPLTGHFLQELGLKMHMYNTFYHYQQASLAPSQAERQKEYEQPLYTGSFTDTLAAPFRWKNLSTPWTFVPILLAGGMLVNNYLSDPIPARNYHSSWGDEGKFILAEGMTVPFGSGFSEEALFRGFVQREFHHYTGSFGAALVLQSLLFTSVHPSTYQPVAFVGGLYFGYVTHVFDGNIEPAIASHFWIDFISATLLYFQFRKSEGRYAPFKLSVSVPVSL
jgi:membrane protease YdiL (CAAX protease family)